MTPVESSITTKQPIFGTTELPKPMEAIQWKLLVTKSEHQSLTSRKLTMTIWKHANFTKH